MPSCADDFPAVRNSCRGKHKLNSEDIRVAIVCESVHHQNTQRVAEAIAEVLHAEIFTPQECVAGKLSAYEVVGLGSGIYFGRHHRLLRQLAATYPELPTDVFIFSTAGLPCFHTLFHGSLRRRLLSRGCRILGEFSCRGWDTVGPLILLGGLNRHHPNQNDMEMAKAFAEHVRLRYTANDAPRKTSELQ